MIKIKIIMIKIIIIIMKYMIILIIILINVIILGLLCDLLWSDPEIDFEGWTESERGVSYVFGSDVV